MSESIISHQRVEEVALSAGDLSRYSRQLLLPEVNAEGQRRIKAARVLCIGAGGLGSPAALYLAAGGIGTLGLVDADRVDASNLQRQILYGTSDVGKSKLEMARTRLEALNPDVAVKLHEARFTSANAEEIVREYDVVIDGSDNFPTRYLSNDVCVFAGKPNIYGSVFRFEGQASVFAPHLGGPCYRCLFPEPPPPGAAPSCAEAGVLGVLPGIIGLIQATEALKLIVGAGDSLAGRLLHFDALKMKFREFNLRRDPQCPVCGDSPTISAPIDYEQFCAGPEPEDDWFAAPEGVPTISVRELKAKMDSNAELLLVDVREPYEYEIARIEGARLIPLGNLEEHADKLPRTGTLVMQCHSGGRSEHAARLLREAGFNNVFNLEGGIDAWSVEIDPDVPRY
ncbi:MAG TPA: molybdopterin-synthase adenylyltransferase MoeB [Chthoniobacterales bacterium]|nr:molybdopterin-synthase adenylyltransferase MoeB [Chthoniobacterales bacterium]